MAFRQEPSSLDDALQTSMGKNGNCAYQLSDPELIGSVIAPNCDRLITACKSTGSIEP
jgi:hypothetical protein